MEKVERSACASRGDSVLRSEGGIGIVGIVFFECVVLICVYSARGLLRRSVVLFAVRYVG